MQVNITPTKLHGTIKAPANKSWIIRYMIVAAMKDSSCTIRNINLCDDVLACMDCLDNLEGVMNCGQSATVLRLLLPSVLKKYGKADFICEGNLINRPLGPYEDLFDISISGNELHAKGKVPDRISIKSSISSQFVSGLLIAGCDVNYESVSSPYIEMTKKVIATQCPFDITVPEDETLKAWWNIGKLKDVSCDESPDMIPCLALQYAVGKGKKEIHGLGRLKYKESDRLHNMETILCKLGADVCINGDTMIINGMESLSGGVVIDPDGDHRMVMMAAIASSYCHEPISIVNADCVSKSYPTFFDDFVSCGGVIDVIY